MTGVLTRIKGAQWRSGRASDSESRGPGFDPHRRHRVVSLSKTHQLPAVLVEPRKSWLRPDMTEKLLTRTLSLNANKIDSGKCKSTGGTQLQRPGADAITQCSRKTK